MMTTEQRLLRLEVEVSILRTDAELRRGEIKELRWTMLRWAAVWCGAFFAGTVVARMVGL